MANNNDTTTLPLLNNTPTPNGLPVTLHDTPNGHSSGLPTPTRNTTVPQLPQTPRKQKWIPDPNDSWSDPKHPEHKTRPRTLVLCFDGTGDQFDDDNSNVVQLLEALKKDDQRLQLVYYQAGIGTYTNSSIVTPVVSQLSKTLDGMFAWNLGEHVMQGYLFLMQNYTAGDKICIFGFSRGAYTARSLAGMIQKVGLLPAHNTQQIPFAWAMYKREDEGGWRSSEGFKKTFSTDVKIEFVGVWDTVASVGIIPRELPFVSSNSAITYFRHALALDERRAKFVPNFYHQSKWKQEPRAKNQPNSEAFSETKPRDAPSSNRNGEHEHGNFKRKPRRQMTQSEMHERAENAKSGFRTDAKEVWFAGCHSDVGGGSVANRTRHSLARIPLRWMIRECFACNTGIIFDADILRDVMGLNVDDLYPVYKPRDPSKRIKPDLEHSIEKPQSDSGGFLLWEIIKVIGLLIAIPISFVSSIAWFPVNQSWLLLKYSPFGIRIRKKLRFVRRRLRIDGPTAEPPLVDGRDHDNSNNREPFKSEEKEDLKDALSPTYDQLSLRWLWWFIELLPLRHRDQKGSREDFFVMMNIGRGRLIYGDARLKGIKVHYSVKTRLEVVDKRGKPVYSPGAFFHVGPKGNRQKITDWNVENPDPKTHWEWVY